MMPTAVTMLESFPGAAPTETIVWSAPEELAAADCVFPVRLLPGSPAEDRFSQRRDGE